MNLFGYNLYLEINKKIKPTTSKSIRISEIPKPHRLIFGPGPNWKKPDNSWLSVDIDPSLGEIVVNFQEFEQLPLKDNSAECVYGSHVF